MNRITYLYPALTLIAVYALGCSSNKIMLEPEGDRALITLQNASSLTAELLAADDSLLYVAVISGWANQQISTNEKLVAIPFHSLQAVTIQGYSNKKWTTSWILFQVVPSILLTATAGAYDSELTGNALLVFGLPTALNGLIFALSTPKPPGFKNRITSAEIEKMKKYFRFPQGLNGIQMERLLKRYGQKNYRVWGQ